jgi:hypothetical protein
VHAVLQVSPRVRVNRTRNATAPLLRGLIFDSEGRAMSPSHSRGRGGQMYRYYVSQAVLKGGAAERPAIPRVPAGEIEAAVVAQVRALLRQPEMAVGTWRAARTTSPDVTEQEVLLALERIEPLWDELFPAERARIVRLLVDRVDVRADGAAVAAAAGRAGQLGAGLGCPGPRGREGGGVSEATQTFTVLIPLRVKPRGGRKAMVTPGVLALDRRQDITLIKAVARAFRWRRLLESGRFGTINELAAAEKINSSYVSRVLRLTLLAPDIVEAILDGRQPEGMTLPALMEQFPAVWAKQCVELGAPSYS